jgi:transcriptional regulator with XRE-family HTH domain
MIRGRCRAILYQQHRMTITCHIRKYRKAAQLTQSDLALLLGFTSQGYVSEIEAGLCWPSVEIVLALSVILDAPLSDLFPAQYKELERCVLERAKSLCGDISAHRPARRHIAALINRLDDAHSNP